MSHTPGPWVVEKPRKGSPLLMVVAERGGMPGLIVNQGPIEPRDTANANLIAAAPDMAACIRQLRESAAMLRSHCRDGSDFYDVLSSMIAGADDMLKKVEGRK